MLKAIQCFGIITTNSSQSMAVDGELKDSVTVSPTRSGIMGMFQVMYHTRETHENVALWDYPNTEGRVEIQRAAEYF